MHKSEKMQALCAAFGVLSQDQSPTDMIRSRKEAIADRIDDLSREIIQAEEPKPTNTKHHSNTKPNDEIPF